MALTLAATINSVATDCTSINFSDTTSNYGISGNPNYTDVTHVKWELYDSSFTNLLGTYDNSGWLPYPSNDVTLFASEFGLGSTFPNGTMGVKYTITYTDSTGASQTLTANTGTFNVQCGASYCNTTLYQLTTAMSGATYPATLTSAKIANTTFTIGGSVSSLADLVSKLNTYLATQTSLAQNIKYSNYAYSGTDLILNNPYYDGTAGHYQVTLGSTTYTIGSAPTINNQVAQQYTITQNCTSGVVDVNVVDTTFTANGIFPEFADVDSVDISLYMQGNGTPLETTTLTANQFQTFVTNGSTIAALFPSATISKCVAYYINPEITLLNGDMVGCYNSNFKLSYCGSLKDSSLVVKGNAKVDSDCTKMVLCDNTGAYNSVYNPTGYGIPNPDYADIIRTEVVITTLEGDVVIIPTEFVPTPNGSNCFSISLTDIFGADTINTTIPVGVYPITYNVYGDCDQLLGTTSYSNFYACGLKACLDQRAQDNLPCGINCNTADWQELLMDYAEYMALAAAAQTNPSCVTEQLQQLYKRCITKCTSCN